MRILFCAWRDTADHRAGGSEVLVDRLATGLSERGHDVTLLCAGPVADHPYRVVANGGRLTQFVRAPWMVRRHVGDIDLIVDVTNGTGFYPALWSRRPRLALVNHLHTDQWDDWFPRPVSDLGRFLEHRLMPWCNRGNLVTAVSPSTARALADLGMDETRIGLVTNGVDPVRHPTQEGPDPLFVAVGRLVPHKRYDRLIHMWDQVRPVTGGRLVIVGAGPEMERLVAIAGPDVELRGEVSDDERDDLYRRAWLLLHPSLVEGWGLVVTEAAARGTPTVAFDVPGLRDSVVDGSTGLLATDEAGFVERWTRVAGDVELRRRLGDSARRRTDAFPWEQTVTDFEALATRAIGVRPSSAPLIPAYPGWRPSTLDRAMAFVDRSLGTTPDSTDAPRPPNRRALARLFLREKYDPEPFYAALAERTVAALPYDLAGARILDVGAGDGSFAAALGHAGADVVAIDQARPEPSSSFAAATGDARRLPVSGSSVDGVFCSNVLEHTPEPAEVLAEIARVLRPGGWAWVSFTNWYSPWGGHEITPWHLLGPHRGLAAYRRRHGEPRKNVPFDELWPIHVGAMRRAARTVPGLRLVDAAPRYYPSQRWILRVPLLREVATWNLLLRFERL